ncbi:MAG TPA: cytochrome c oxidase subunit II [Acidimicrobiia bacterium]|nr:cytochrome c oxidase subunit II [Acidimicrobiia bacterium]
MSRRARNIVATGVALALAGLLLAGCGNSKSPNMLDPKGTEARDIASVWWLMFGLAAFVYIVVGGLIIYAVRKGRRRSRAERDANDSVEPDTPRFDDHMVLWGGIVVPLVILFVLAVVTVTTTNALRRPASDALRIDVVGKRWWWAVSYPTTHFVTANDIHLPAGRPIELHLTTADVIHSFWVPQLAGKVDMIPNQDNLLRFVAKTPGTYRGECAEFCGLQHAHMDFVVVVQSQGDYDRWVAEHAQPPVEPASELADEGQVAFDSEACAGCHTIDGTPAQGKVGPNLTDLGERPYLGAGALENTPENLKQWITNAQRSKPGALMPPIQLSSAKASAIVAYLESLQ